MTPVSGNGLVCQKRGRLVVVARRTKNIKITVFIEDKVKLKRLTRSNRHQCPQLCVGCAPLRRRFELKPVARNLPRSIGDCRGLLEFVQWSPWSFDLRTDSRSKNLRHQPPTVTLTLRRHRSAIQLCSFEAGRSRRDWNCRHAAGAGFATCGAVTLDAIASRLRNRAPAYPERLAAEALPARKPSASFVDAGAQPAADVRCDFDRDYRRRVDVRICFRVLS